MIQKRKLLYTDNIGFDMKDWEKESISKVFAGNGCIMALTDKGKVLQKTDNPNTAANVDYWRNIKQISLSKLIPGLAIGLNADGTCEISEKALYNSGYSGYRTNSIYDTVMQLKNIVQVEVSDTLFALDYHGNVLCSEGAFSKYYGVNHWNGVRRIVTGLQDSVFGITLDGRILYAGANVQRGPHGDIGKYTSSLSGVRDIYPTGSECEDLFIVFNDGTVKNLYDKTLYTDALQAPSGKIIDGHFNYSSFVLNSERQLVDVSRRNADANPIFNGRKKIVSFAVGDHGYSKPFVLAVAE